MSSGVWWSRDETTELERLFALGVGAEVIASRMHRSLGAVRSRIEFLGLKRVEPPCAGRREDEPTRSALIKASVWHLIDLKRAGHSPRRTELVLAVDGALPQRFSTAAASSSCGSPAASCVESAG